MLSFPKDSPRKNQGSFIVGTRDLRVDGEWRSPGDPFPEAWDLPDQRRRALLDEKRIAFVWADSPAVSADDEVTRKRLRFAVSLMSKRGCVDLLNGLDMKAEAAEADGMARDQARKLTAETLGVA